MPVKLWRVGEDVVFQPLQHGPRVDAQFLDEAGTGASEDCQRFGLPSSAVQRQSQQLAAVFAQRVGPYVHLQLGHRAVVFTQLQLRLAPCLHHRQPQLLQPGYLRTCPWGVTHIGVSLSSPESQRCLKFVYRTLEIAATQRSPPGCGMLIEPVYIEIHPVAVQQITRSSGTEHCCRCSRRPVRFQHPP